MSAGAGRWFAPRGSPLIPWLEGLAWLWRLGARRDEPASDVVGFGTLADADGFDALLRDGRLAGAVVLASEPGPARGPVPARRREAGRARFDAGTRVSGEFTILAEGAPAARSTLGLHAVRRDRVLILGADEAAGWGRLDAFWVYEALAAFLTDVAARPLLKLPPVGCVRLDDYPGTAQHQLEGRAKSDRRQSRRIERLSRCYRETGATLNVAVTAEALREGARVPLERVWPESVRALREGARSGAFEVVCHGLLLLATDALAEGRVDYREFARLGRDEAGRRIDMAIAWLADNVARPKTFVAPAWVYGPAAAAEAHERSLPTWHWPSPGPLIDGDEVRETLIDGLPGIVGLDYSPLGRLAAVGVPPTVVMHGALLDGRLANPLLQRNPIALARLALRRDIFRLPGVEGVRWLGAGDFVDALREHSQSSPDARNRVVESVAPHADQAARLEPGEAQ